MMIMFVLFGMASVLEFLLPYTVARKLGRSAALIAITALTFSSGAILGQYPSLFTFVIMLTSLYRAFNMVRVISGRMHEKYLRRVSRRTTLQLLALQGTVGAFLWIWQVYGTTLGSLWLKIAMVQLVVAIVLLSSTIRRLKRTTWPAEAAPYSDGELPTLTVAIPARNETDDLQQCLHSLVGSNYPKLEILVLDDCSQLKRTPEIIRQFAHDGVRFIQGHEPSETWLPKNEAYARLAEEASGDYILFCGVDMRFEKDSLRKLMSQMVYRKKTMVTVLPQREEQAVSHFSLIQAMRYWWELAPPRRLFKRPPVLSSCWVIHHHALAKAGGFAAVRRSITPEAHFARQSLQDDGYSFLRSNATLNIVSVKPGTEQLETAVRMRYPQLHRRPELALLISLFEMICLVLPFVLAVVGFWLHMGLPAHMLTVAASLMLAIAYGLIAVQTRINTWWFAPFAFPLVVLVDIALLHLSMFKYEFSIVDWKGRNVCIPVMHVIPHLPEVH